MSHSRRPQKVVKFSLDYDFCGDILFDDYRMRLTRYYSENGMYAESRLIKSLVLKQRQRLMAYLDAAVTRANDQYGKENVKVILAVGSSRQDIITDEYASERCQNGSCFENFQALCDEKGWIFERKLEADNHYSDGGEIAMFNRNKRCHRDVTKLNIVPAQITDVQRNHPDATDIEFHFVDDDPEQGEIMRAVSDHLAKYGETIGNNMAVILTRFTYICGMREITAWLKQTESQDIKSRWLNITELTEVGRYGNAVDLSIMNSAAAAATGGFFSGSTRSVVAMNASIDPAIAESRALIHSAIERAGQVAVQVANATTAADQAAADAESISDEAKKQYPPFDSEAYNNEKDVMRAPYVRR